jgi:hypothetical protein
MTEASTENQSAILVESIPWDAIPADVYYNDQILRFQFMNKDTVPIDLEIEREKSEWKHQMMRYTQLHEPETHDTGETPNSKIQIISDSSIYDLQGTFGVMRSRDTKMITTNKGKIYSTDFIQSP